MLAASYKPMSWIDKIVRSTKNLESPERYFWWGALAAISAVIRKQVFLDRGGAYKLFPNIYVILVSKHSGLRKGIAVSLASRLINGVANTRVIEGRNSVQAIITEFSRQMTLPNGRILSDAQGILVSGELDNLFVKDPQALTILTELYNTHEHQGKWKNTLKGSGVEELKNPCVSLLGASNEVLFESMIQKKDVEGGFIARSFIVHESKRKTSNPLTEKDPDLMKDESLIEELKEISKIQGEFNFSPRAKRNYEQWYEELGEAIENESIVDKTGYIHRLGDSVLKVAMLINLSRDRDLTIHAYDLEEAIEHAESCLSGVRIVSHSSTSQDPLASLGRRVIELLMKSKDYSMSRPKILLTMNPDLNPTMLNNIMDNLEQAGCVKISRVDDKLWYTLLEPALQLFSTAKKNYL